MSPGHIFQFWEKQYPAHALLPSTTSNRPTAVFILATHGVPASVAMLAVFLRAAFLLKTVLMTTDNNCVGHDERRQLLKISAPYNQSRLTRSVSQVSSTLGLWLFSYLAGLAMVGNSWFGTGVAVTTSAAFIVRLFIIQHDCGHRSFFRSRRANDLLGFWLGVITMTPYRCWLRFHAQHHVDSGNLCKRGMGDIHTLTTREYERLTKLQQRRYRIYRHPLVLLVLGPPLLFILRQRTPYKVPKTWTVERRSIALTNVAWMAMIAIPCMVFGPLATFCFHLTMMSLAAMGGVWLFYLQHQFPESYWRHGDEWVSWRASMEGASYLDLPSGLRWLTASIGLHHIHHLDPRIPNYRLYECFRRHPEFAKAPRITLRDSWACLKIRLWDEEAHRMVPLQSYRPKQVGKK